MNFTVTENSGVQTCSFIYVIQINFPSQVPVCLMQTIHSIHVIPSAISQLPVQDVNTLGYEWAASSISWVLKQLDIWGCRVLGPR